MSDVMTNVGTGCRQFWQNLLRSAVSPVTPLTTPGPATRGLQTGLPTGASYPVGQGDTLYGMGREHGFDWQDSQILRDGQMYDIGPGGIDPGDLQEGDRVVPRSGRDLGHGSGVDGDEGVGATDAQGAVNDAEQSGGGEDVERSSQACPTCKVAIVVGHNARAQGADSAGPSEYVYNTDIANRTLAKITEKGGGEVEGQIFYRIDQRSYSREIAAVYAEVNAFLSEVTAQKRIAIELHYNSAGPTASYALTIYKGNAGFATESAARMAEIYGVRSQIKHYTDNERGQATFIQGPTNTYLMEPFFGSHAASAEIANTEAAKDQLAEVYADLLVDWIK